MKKEFFYTFIISMLVVSCAKSVEPSTDSHYIMAILEAKPGSEDELREELVKVMELSRKEKACLDYRVHQSTDNPAQFILYENWTSKEDHAPQFKRDYIIAIGRKLETLLCKPFIYINSKLLS